MSPIPLMTEDVGAFWKLIDEHRASLWRFTLGLTRSRDDARDLISETVLAAYRSYPKLRDRGAFKKSLFTIAVRIYRRQEWRKRLFRFGELPEQAHSNMRESQHDLDLLMQTLACLPAKQREAILLFDISGFSLEEIQSVQGGSLSGVKSRVKRGREALREQMLDRKDQATKIVSIEQVLA